jgi:hypothetical protein
LVVSADRRAATGLTDCRGSAELTLRTGRAVIAVGLFALAQAEL